MNGIALSETLPGRKSEVTRSAGAALASAELWFSAISATLIPLSLIWDFSWESSIGVDRFWSPPHLATYIGVWLNGFCAAWLIIRFSFLQLPKTETANGLQVAALSGPSGAWVMLWAAVLVQVTLVLDQWWQQTYGLAAGLWPPPQI